MPNVEAHIPIILVCPFLVASITLINYRNGMMKPSLGNVTLDLNVLNLQRQPYGFDVVAHYILIG